MGKAENEEGIRVVWSGIHEKRRGKVKEDMAVCLK